MLLRLLPEPSPQPEEKQNLNKDDPLTERLLPKKRVFSAIEETLTILEKSSVPALASLLRIQELVGRTERYSRSKLS